MQRQAAVAPFTGLQQLASAFGCIDWFVVPVQAGQLCRTQIPADKATLLATLAPFRPDVVVAVECLFAWYWVADLCAAEQLPFVLGHALYMKAIHGGKAKNDDIDAEKIARLLKGGNIPVAYVYPKGLRKTRDLLRRRMYFVQQRRPHSDVEYGNLPTSLRLIGRPYGKRGFLSRVARRDVATAALLLSRHLTWRPAMLA